MKKILLLITALLISTSVNAQETKKNWIKVSDDTIIYWLNDDNNIGILENTIIHNEKKEGKYRGGIEGTLGEVIVLKNEYFFVPLMIAMMGDDECSGFPFNKDGGLIFYLYPNKKLYKILPYKKLGDDSLSGLIAMYLCHTANS